MPWIASRCVTGSISGVPAWWRSKIRPFGVMMPGWYCSGVMLQSDQFCRFFRTSLRRRATCASYFEGMPYMASGIGRPGSCALGATGSGAAPALAAIAPPVNAAVLRKKSLRLEILAMGPPASNCRSRMSPQLGDGERSRIARFGRLQRTPYALRGCRHVEMRDAGLAQCVEHCVHQARHRAGDPGLAHAFGAERVGLSRHRIVEDPEVVHQERARHRVVHEAAVQQLAAVRVIDRLLAENVAGTLSDAALHLSFDDLVVDDVAGVVAGDVADDFRDAGFRLDLHLRDVAAVGESRPDLLLLQVDIELPGMLLHQRCERDPAVGALDAVFALEEFEVGCGGLQLFGRERE